MEVDIREDIRMLLEDLVVINTTETSRTTVEDMTDTTDNKVTTTDKEDTTDNSLVKVDITDNTQVVEDTTDI